MSIAKFRHYPSPKSFNNLMVDLLPQFPSFSGDVHATGLGQSIPVNIRQNNEGYELEVVAPGFKKEDFKISLEKETLTISADRKTQAEINNQKNIRTEYKYQSFKRSFSLDEKIDTEKIEAKYENGVLTLNLYNRPEVKAPVKQINIQ